MSKTLISLFVFFLAIPNCLASDGKSSAVLGKITNIKVTENGRGPSNENCASFQVTPAKLSSFLRNAILIDGRQQHDWFLHGPCYARGTFKNRYGDWQWELRNLGTATITSITGETFILADPRQESSPEGE